MSNNRKTIKVTIPSDKVAEFDDLKKRAEDSSMMKMSDTQYASRLIQWAIERNAKDNQF